MRQDEEYAKEAFGRMVCSQGPAPIRWRRGRNPPDYYLRVKGRSFVVEVTQVMESIQVGTRRISERGASESLETLRQEVEARARRSGVLEGTYALHLCPIPNLNQTREDLISGALNYIARTRDLDSAQAICLVQGRRGEESLIEKINNRHSIVGASFSIGEAKWQIEVQQELTQLLTGLVRKKQLQLRRVRLHAILLLVDAYHYADKKDWYICAKSLGFSGFHTIARVYSDFQCQVLTSRDASWSA